MELLKIRDNSRYQSSIFSKISALTNKIANKTLKQLEQEGVFVFPELVVKAEDITHDQIIIRKLDNECCSGNILGFLGYGDDRLIIRSRFDNEQNDYFIQYMLSQVIDYPNIIDLFTDANQEKQLFNFLLFLFPLYLKKALRKGVFKKYIRNNYNDDNVKGTIDIATHLKRNTPFTGNISYFKREFSFDNYLTELIRHTIESIKKKPYGNQILFKAKDEISEIIWATPSFNPNDKLKITQINQKNTLHHAFFSEYLALQRLCLFILKHQKHLIGAGTRQIYGILFDGSWLWEEYINLLIKDKFFHPMNKGSSGAQRLFEGHVGLIYPDFIGRNSKFRSIADAKYKPLENIGNKDYLQLLAYMFRFKAKTGYYLYPDAIGSEDLLLHMNEGTTYESNVNPCEDICVTKHGLKIPSKATDYDDFVRQIKHSEDVFKQIFMTA